MSKASRHHLIAIILAALLTACTSRPLVAPGSQATSPPSPVPCDPEALSEALAGSQAAAAPLTLSLAPGCTYTLRQIYPSPPPWHSGLPPIRQAIVIEGRNAVIARDPVAPNFRLFYIAPGGSLILRDLTLRNGKTVAAVGHAAAGGAIYSAGTLSLQHVTLQDNQAVGGFGTDGGPVSTTPGYPALGGALFVAGGTVSVHNSTIRANQATGGSGADFVCSTVTGGDCRHSRVAQGAESLDLTQTGNLGVGGRGGISGNATPVPGDAGGYAGGPGGAGTLALRSNIGGVPHQVGGYGGGGGGAGLGGALFIAGGTVTVTDSTFAGNQVTGGLGALGEGSGCCHSPAGEPGQGLGVDIFWQQGSLALSGTEALLAR